MILGPCVEVIESHEKKGWLKRLYLLYAHELDIMTLTRNGRETLGRTLLSVFPPCE